MIIENNDEGGLYNAEIKLKYMTGEMKKILEGIHSLDGIFLKKIIMVKIIEEK